jgi:hypothetical protein
MPPLCAWRSRKANIMGVIDNPDFTPSKLIELVPKNSVEFSPDRRVIKVPFRDKCGRRSRRPRSSVSALSQNEDIADARRLASEDVRDEQ